MIKINKTKQMDLQFIIDLLTKCKNDDEYAIRKYDDITWSEYFSDEFIKFVESNSSTNFYCAAILIDGCYFGSFSIKKPYNTCTLKYYPKFNGKEIVELFENAAMKNNGRVKYKLGQMYHKGIIVTKDENKAVQYYRDAIDNGFELAVKQYYELCTTCDNEGGIFAYIFGDDDDKIVCKDKMILCENMVEFYENALEKGMTCVYQDLLSACYMLSALYRDDEKKRIKYSVRYLHMVLFGNFKMGLSLDRIIYDNRLFIKEFNEIILESYIMSDGDKKKFEEMLYSKKLDAKYTIDGINKLPLIIKMLREQRKIELKQILLKKSNNKLLSEIITTHILPKVM